MDCVNCGAPLEAKSRICRFCGALNDVDLRKVRRDKLHVGERPCPRCKEPLRVLRLEVQTEDGEALEVDRCDACHGIFFDPGELEEILEQAESRAQRLSQHVDHQRLGVLIEEETDTRDFRQVAYVPCPDCEKLMHRRNFGSRSGVIVDRCHDHGVWLDGGELRRLVEWVRAGGRTHHEKMEAERKATEERAARARSGEMPTGAYDPADWGHDRGRGLGGGSVGNLGGGIFSAGFDLFDLLGVVARLLR